jgi:RNA polymerase sigma-70 factor (ECF subfamily)
MDDETLISRAQGGDAAAFARLLDLYYDTIYRFAWKWCGHEANAEDIAQLACMKLAAGIKQFRHQSAFTSWLYKLVINCAQDWQRSQKRHDHDELSELEPDGGASRAEDRIYLLQVFEQLDELGEGMKETALLVHAEGLSHAEAGEALGVSESTVSWRIHVIRRQMSKHEARKSGVL